jgi:pyruvate/2-oxoglutarate/acetoin dehydrogenase E1 component
MTYKESLAAAMTELARDPLVRFIGYGVKVGAIAGKGFGGVNPAQLVETPVAENLMVGMAIGMSLAGLRPVVYIERMDFILNALDAIVNHLDKIGQMSHGEFKPAIILRVVVGNKTKPLYTGATHVQDFTGALREMVTFPVITLDKPVGSEPIEIEIGKHYRFAHERLAQGESTMLVEYKDLI